MHDPIDDAAAKSRAWARDVAVELGIDERRAWAALRATLHALRDRLPVDDAVKVAAHLPVLLRGVYYEGWRPAHAPVRLHVEDIVARVAAEAHVPDAQRGARACFRVLARHAPAGLIDHVQSLVPADLRAFIAAARRVEDREELYAKAAAAAAEWP